MNDKEHLIAFLTNGNSAEKPPEIIGRIELGLLEEVCLSFDDRYVPDKAPIYSMGYLSRLGHIILLSGSQRIAQRLSEYLEANNKKYYSLDPLVRAYGFVALYHSGYPRLALNSLISLTERWIESDKETFTQIIASDGSANSILLFSHWWCFPLDDDIRKKILNWLANKLPWVKKEEIVSALKSNILEKIKAMEQEKGGSWENKATSNRRERENATVSILFLAADPTDASRLRLGEEFRELQEKLKLAKLRDQFRLELPQLSVRPADISQALLDVEPRIVHFSGHGASTGALCFENQTGQIQLVQPDALAALFEQFANQVSCVLLNACYSETQAKAIAEYIEYVIGMNRAIGDKAAIAFAIGFYQALGAGRTIEEAYKLGCVQIRLQGIPEHLTPVLVKKVQTKPLLQEASKPQSSTGSRQPPSKVAVSLVFNKAGLVINDEPELKASLVEALFAAENQLPVTFNVTFEPLEAVERYIKSIDSGEASPENRITKVNLQRQARALETKHKVVTLALSLFLLPPLRHHFISADELIESLHGLARLSFDFQCDETASSLSLAIFRKDDPKLSTVIWIDETEQEQIKAHSGSDNVFATLIGCDLFDLPRKTRFGKAIPVIIFIIAFEAVRTDQYIYNLFDLSKVLDLHSWSVGMH